MDGVHNSVGYMIFFCLFHYCVGFFLLQELFSKQKGFLEEELDYRKQALDQAYMVRGLERHNLTSRYKTGLSL